MNKQEILAILQKHPCTGLPVTEEKRQAILTRGVYRDYLEEIRAEGKKYKETPAVSIPYSAFKLFETTGDRTVFQGYYFNNRGRLATLALLTWLDGGEENIHALEDAIWTVCDEYTWALPAHLNGKGLSHVEDEGYMIDLFAAETASALSEILALVGDVLSPIVVKRARYLVKKRVLDRLLEQPFGWEKANNNWASVCGGSVGLAALYETEGEQLAALLERTEGAMESYVASFPADGTSMEGISYWTYGFSFFVAYAEMLLRRTGGEMDWFKDPRVRNIALFQQKAYFAGGNIICFADCGKGDTARWWGLTSYLRSRYEDIEPLPRSYFSSYTGDPCYRWAGILRDLAWSSEALPENNQPQKSYILPDAQWLICNSKAGVSFAAKGGTNGESHNHNDIGHVQLFKNGEEILLDYGSGLYSRAYFSDQRYTIFNCGSQGHSVPIVEGCYQAAGHEHGAQNVRFGEWFMEMDIASAYEDENLVSLIRRVAFDPESGRMTLQDTFTFKTAPTGITERFVTRCTPSVSGGAVTLTGENTAAVLTFDEAQLSAECKTQTADKPRTVAGEAVPDVLQLVDFTAKAPGTVCSFTFTLE